LKSWLAANEKSEQIERRARNVSTERSDPAIQRLAEALKATLGSPAVRLNQPLSRCTMLRIGGPADLLLIAGNLEVLRQAVALAWEHDVPCLVLGGGSNVLVSDAGVRGLVVLNRAEAIALPAAPTRQVVDGGNGSTGKRALARAEGGASLSVLAQRCVTRGLAGLEWAVGIPGTVGGAVVGNAGAWGGDMASSLARVTVLEPGGAVVQWPVERLEYSYRSSILKRRSPGSATGVPAEPGEKKPVVLEVGLAVERGDRAALQRRVAEIRARRKASQPMGATCGSVFKNPPGDFAGRLVEAAGLKGRRSGDAQISARHANFIVNEGTATAADVRTLIELMRQEVQVRFGLALELEIELIGDWSAWSSSRPEGSTAVERFLSY
jgi:UDP-N-acetylmuramate dehydrogenase